ncbi:uncharacterized protein LOC144421033 [Styela clava]
MESNDAKNGGTRDKAEKKYYQKFKDEHTQSMGKQKEDLESSLKLLSSSYIEKSDMWKVMKQEMEKQQQRLEEKWDQKLQEQMKKQRDDLGRENKVNIGNLKEKVKKKIGEELKLKYPDHPDIIFKQLGGETHISSYIDSLTKGVEKRLESKAEALERYRKWVKDAKSNCSKKVATRVVMGGVAGAAISAVNNALIIGSEAALANVGIAGISVDIASLQATGIVLACFAAGSIIVFTAYGIYWAYREYKTEDALKQPNREILLDHLAQRFIIDAEEKKG